MILLAALFAFIQPTPTSPRSSAADDELFCVYNALDQKTLANMGELITDNGQDSLHEIGEYAADAVDDCEKTWKWDAEQRAVAALTASARAAIQINEQWLNERYSHSQLQALFNQMTDEEKYSLTIDGQSRLDARGRYKQAQQLEALFKRNQVRGTDHFSMTALFVAVARYEELRGAWTGLGQKR